MKYIVKLELKNPVIRSDYRRTIISFFKKAISSYMDGYFYDELYKSGAKKKSFVWSIAFNKPVFKGEKIELEGNEVNMTLKFEEAQTALIYYSSLLNMKNKAFPVGDNNEISLKNIKMISEKEITDDYAVFKILSPICLKCHSRENKKDRYLTVEDDDFALELARKLKDDIPYMEEEIDTLRYDLSGLKKIIVPVYGLKIPVSIGNFIISGDKKILNHILKTGIGSKRNSGFGLVEQIV